MKIELTNGDSDNQLENSRDFSNNSDCGDPCCRSKLEYYQSQSEFLLKDVERLKEALKKSESELEKLRNANKSADSHCDNKIEYFAIINDLDDKVSRFSESKVQLEQENSDLNNQLQTERSVVEELRIEIQKKLNENRQLRGRLKIATLNDAKNFNTNVLSSAESTTFCGNGPQPSTSKNEILLVNLRLKADLLFGGLVDIIKRSENLSRIVREQNRKSKVEFSGDVHSAKPLFHSSNSNGPYNIPDVSTEVKFLRQKTCDTQLRCNSLEAQLAEKDDHIIALRTQIEQMEQDKGSRRAEISHLMNHFPV